jgi:riboflavin biosynthesis pyrimidine reductase
MKPIELLFERPGLPSCTLPAALATSYGGGFSLARPGCYANFVTSLDGVVALADAGESGHLISGDDEADRFIMGLLRASADAVMIGAGTFRKTRGALWHPETIYPAAAMPFALLRRHLGMGSHPLLVVVSASGLLDTAEPALRDALIVTTPEGETQLQGRLPKGARLAVLEGPRIKGRSLLDLLHAQGLQVILAEGGPSLVGQLLEGGLLDELFLTRSPRLFGRQAGDDRKSLVEGVELAGRSMQLSSVRRHESHLYLRYSH